MNAPRKSALAVLAVTAALCAAAYFGSMAFPPLRVVNNPQLAALRAEQTHLQSFTDDAARTADARLIALRDKLWNTETFSAWRKANVPDAWVVQDLGSAALTRVHARRWAFSRPNATDKEWGEITAVLAALENAPRVSVQSAALAVQPGYIGSHRFTQCLFVAAFYFGDDLSAPPSH